jgi:hypothetical protein
LKGPHAGKLTERKTAGALCFYFATEPAVQDRDAAILRDWHPISTAPFDRDLQLSVIEQGEVYSLVFPCRRTENGWMEATTWKPVPVEPTHWREWPNQTSN